MFSLCFGRSSDDIIEPKTPSQIIEEAECKCYTIKDSKDNKKTCTKVVNINGKIITKKCCNKETSIKTVKDGKIQCSKKPPPAPVLKIVEPQNKRKTK